MSRLILASASPRRQALLSRFDIDFDVIVPRIDESKVVSRAQGATDASSASETLGTSRTWDTLGAPEELVCLIAEAKGASVVVNQRGKVVISADTVVAIDGQILGKPRDDADARRMLKELSGRTHSVYTGVSVIGHQGKMIRTSHVKTDVTFGKLSEETIDAYVQTGEPLDKAGAYGIQDRGGVFVKHIDGCYFNVVGLPLHRLSEMLIPFGIRLL